VSGLEKSLDTVGSQHGMLALATVLGAAGIWLLLPRGGARGRRLGALLGLASLGILAYEMPPLGELGGAVVFYVLAGVTVISAVAAVTFRSPVYCAIWFALSLLGTSGLFLFQGAQFLGVATVVVYAGAILVTFLFVLMLAQPEGDAFYDRISWEGLLSACTGALMVGVLTLTVVGVLRDPDVALRPVPAFTAEQLDKQVLSSEHMAHLGGELFSRYLIAVEVAGTLLLVALVGAVAIVSQSSKLTGGPSGSTGEERLDPRVVISQSAQALLAQRAASAAPQEVLHG
jgi:NADH-quinone oxidoreductase subunit J